MTDEVLTGTADWRERRIVPAVLTGARSIHFGFYLRGAGGVWTRRFRFREANGSLAVNAGELPARCEPTNLDFAAVA